MIQPTNSVSRKQPKKYLLIFGKVYLNNGTSVSFL
nr:MAG TPA: hypothetical protein [Caudoviricetes sp.]